MKVFERERYDWIMILIILVIGFLCVLIAGQWALRFSPRWKLDASMESHLNPDSDFLTNKPGGYIEPIDPAILTQPGWVNVFLTPGASYVTGTPFAVASATLPATSTTVLPVTSTAEVTAIPTNTFVPLPWVPTPTSKPPQTNHPTETFTPTFTPMMIATATPTPTATPTDTPPPVADLQITKNDNASTYVANGTLTYTVTINNSGPSGISGAFITNIIPAQITNWNWACTAQNGGASGCDAMTGSTDFSDTVDLPNGASIIYSVTANISSSPSGDLTSTANLSLPAGFTDPSPGNNSATDTNQILLSNPFPSGNIDETKNGSITNLPSGSSVTLAFSTPLTVGTGNYLVYYEMGVSGTSGIQMDGVLIEISDGYNWYTIFNWGAGGADINSNLNVAVIGGSENDNRDFSFIPASDVLYPLGTGTVGNPATGITIQVDGVVPNGTYPYIRITSPSGDGGADGCDVDGIEILP